VPDISATQLKINFLLDIGHVKNGNGMELDIRMLITLGGILASVVSASAIARQQIKHLEEELKELKSFTNKMELRLDRNDMTTSINEQKLTELSVVSSPKEREGLVRELEGLKKDIAFLHKTGNN
jgi:hypothetical protein